MFALTVRRSVVLVILCAGTVMPVMAVDPLTGAAPANSARNYVAMGQSEYYPAGQAGCTETHLGNGVILTAAHCVYFNPGNPRYMSIARVELGGRQYMAASITHPAYTNFVGLGANDIALRYIINGQTANAAPAGILASAADDAWIIARINPAAGAPAPIDVRMVGWQSADNTTSGTLLEGVTRMFRGNAGAPAGFGRGYRAGEWIYDRSEGPVAGGYTGSNGFNQGDSGGPSFAMVNGVERLIGVHSFRTANAGAAAGSDVDTRVSPHLDFIAGRGTAPAGGVGENVGAWVRWNTNPGIGGWNNTNWNRQSNPAANVIPRDGDFVILDPTANSDQGAYTVQLSFADSANIMGLANDVRLEVSSGVALRVTGQTGIVSSGSIIASGAGTRVISQTQLDNGGTVRAETGAVVRVGFGLNGSELVPVGNPPVNTVTVTKSVYNSPAGTIELASGSRFESNTQLDNHGDVRIGSNVNGQPSVMEVGAGLPQFTGPAAAPTLYPVAINNGRFDGVDPAGNAQFLIDAGGRVNVSNGPQRTAMFSNGTRGELIVRGDATKTGEMTADFAVNYGRTTILGGGAVTTRNSYFNYAGARTTLDGDRTNGEGRLTGAILNRAVEAGVAAAPAGIIEINARGRVDARPSQDNPGLALENQAGARITIGSQGTLNVSGDADNSGRLEMTSGVDIPQYNGLPRAVPGGVDPRTTNFGRITLAGTVETLPAFNITSHDFTNSVTGIITGPGQFVMSGSSDWTSEATTRTGNTSNFNGLNMLWDGAGTSTTPATFEALSRNISNVEAGLSHQFAFNLLCFANASQVSITDSINNDGGADVLYTRYLGITSDSRVDLNGRTIYYLLADDSCGLDLSRFYGGTVAQIPTPSGALLLSLAGIMVTRRRRARCVG